MDTYIKKYFEDNISGYLKEESSRNKSENSFIVAALEKAIKNKAGGFKILEVGGAGGALLKDILDKYPSQAEAFNLELASGYKSLLCDERINFIPGSIFDNKFADGYFDCVICRYSLHHFVGRTACLTLARQQSAIAEMSRILNKGGLLIIEEELADRSYASYGIFYISLIFSFLRISFGQRIRPGLIVFFLTERKFFALLNRAGKGYSIIDKRVIRPSLSFFNKIIFLFQGVSRVTYIFEHEV